MPAPAPDQAIAWHYGDPLGEQRRASGAGLIDLSNRDVLVVPGPDRLEWLHAICSQHVAALADGESSQALVLSPNGHVEQHWQLTELDGQVWLDTEPGAAEQVLAYLLKMRFLKRVEPAIVTADFALLAVLGPSAADRAGRGRAAGAGRPGAGAAGRRVRPARPTTGSRS